MLLRRRRRTSPAGADLDRVALDVPGVGFYGAGVVRAQPGVVDLRLDDRAACGALDGRAAVLISVGDRRIDGRLELGFTPGEVRFVREGLQRRVHDRVLVQRELVLLPAVMEGVWRTRSRDLAVGGALVADAARLPLGGRLRLEIPLTRVATQRLRAQARVVRAPTATLRAVRFEGLGLRGSDLLAAELDALRERD